MRYHAWIILQVVLCYQQMPGIQALIGTKTNAIETSEMIGFYASVMAS